ncbi:uncharacterized protein V1477_012767 [Vespula maculifrons]|uniref:Uncharacterized protein n=1 Tax=Vespula maculifrons TaxID=7453 RepID=A0ABD2BTZ1_VESMC
MKAVTCWLYPFLLPFRRAILLENEKEFPIKCWNQRGAKQKEIEKGERERNHEEGSLYNLQEILSRERMNFARLIKERRSTSSIQLEGVHPFELPRFDSHLQHQCTGKVRGDEEMKRKRRRRNSQGIEKSMHRHAGMGLREAERIFKSSETYGYRCCFSNFMLYGADYLLMEDLSSSGWSKSTGITSHATIYCTTH